MKVILNVSVLFWRSIQGGLMWRQTGPIIISMSYMILDVAVFLFIFVIVYISFTLRYVQFKSLHSSINKMHWNNRSYSKVNIFVSLFSVWFTFMRFIAMIEHLISIHIKWRSSYFSGRWSEQEIRNLPVIVTKCSIKWFK